MQLALNDDVIKGFKCGRVLKDNKAEINSLDFHRTQDLLVTASNDDTLQIYDISEGKKLFEVPSHKYGAQSIVWTHSPEYVVFASNKGDDHAVRYLHLAAGGAFRFIHYYRGHQGRVTKVAFNPKNDTFISAAQDKEVRLWDLRTPQCQAVLKCPCQPTVAIDQQGLVFAVGLDNGIIKMYDASHYEQGPFDTFVVPDLRNSPVPFSHISFSNDGTKMLAVADGKVFILDAYNGSLQRVFANGVTEAGAAPEASFSCDGQYVMSGCEDKVLRIWNISTGNLVTTLSKQHPGVPYCAKFAPRRLLAASACGAVCLWIPGSEVVQQQLQLLQQPYQQQYQQQPQPMMQ